MVGIAFLGTFILDPEGGVKQRAFEDFYIERNAVSNLLIKLGDKTGTSVPATKNSTALLDVTTYPSSPGVAARSCYTTTILVQ